MPLNERFSVAGREDVDTLVGLVGEFTAEEGYPFEYASVRLVVERMLAEQDLGRAWFIWDDGELAGFVVACFGWSVEFRGRDALIDELFVRPRFRGRGHGTAALRLVREQAPALGIHALHLEVERYNDGARRLYERLGYSDRDRHLMTLRLTPPGDADVAAT